MSHKSFICVTPLRPTSFCRHALAQVSGIYLALGLGKIAMEPARDAAIANLEEGGRFAIAERSDACETAWMKATTRGWMAGGGNRPTKNDPFAPARFVHGGNRREQGLRVWM